MGRMFSPLELPYGPWLRSMPRFVCYCVYNVGDGLYGQNESNSPGIGFVI